MKITIHVLLLTAVLSGCGEYAAKGAGEGASMGAVSGAVGGLVGALVFGGDPAEAAARGVVYGGATGATAGAISGSRVDEKIEAQRAAKAEKVRQKIGDDAFNGLKSLVNCDYAGAVKQADVAKHSNNPNFSVAGYWLETLTYSDQGSSDMINRLLPDVISKDWDIPDESEARKSLLQLQDKLIAIRKEYKLPEHCN